VDRKCVNARSPGRGGDNTKYGKKTGVSREGSQLNKITTKYFGVSKSSAKKIQGGFLKATGGRLDRRERKSDLGSIQSHKNRSVGWRKAGTAPGGNEETRGRRFAKKEAGSLTSEVVGKRVGTGGRIGYGLRDQGSKRIAGAGRSEKKKKGDNGRKGKDENRVP